jgi:hypothetical protein
VGLGAPEPLEAAKKFVLLCHTPCVTLPEKWLIAPHLRGSTKEPPWWLRAYLLVPGPWLVAEAERELRIGSRLPMIRSPRLGRAPEP